MWCPSCGIKAEPHGTFCGGCGKALPRGGPAETAAPVAAALAPQMGGDRDTSRAVPFATPPQVSTQLAAAPMAFSPTSAPTEGFPPPAGATAAWGAPPAVGPPGPAPYAAPGAGRPVWLRWLDAVAFKAMVLDTVLSVAAAFGLALLVAVVLNETASGYVNSGKSSVGDLMRAAGLTVGLALRGALTVAVGGRYNTDGDVSGQATGTGSGHAVPLLVTLVLLGIPALRLARRGRKAASGTSPLEPLSKAAVSAVLLVLAVLGVTASSGIHIADGSGSTVSADIGEGATGLLGSGLLLAFAALAIAALRPWLRQRPAFALPGWLVDATGAVRFVVGSVVATGLIVTVAATIEVLRLDTGNDTAAALGIVAGLLPNLVVLGAAVLTGGTVGEDATGSQVGGSSSDSNLDMHNGYGLFATHGSILNGYYVVAVALAVLAVAVLASARRLREDPRAAWSTSLLSTVAAVAVVWLPLILLTRIDGSSSAPFVVDGTNSTTGSGSAHLGIPSTLLSWVVVAVVASLLGRLLAPVLVSGMPRVMFRLAGRPHPDWQRAVGARAGADLPPAPGVAEPFRIRSGARAVFFVGLVLVLATGGVATAGAVIIGHRYTPQAAVTAAYAALASGDVTALTPLVAGSDFQGSTFSAAVLKQADRGSHPLHDVVVTNVNLQDTTALVDVSYMLGDQKRTSTLAVDRDDNDRHYGLWSSWRIENFTGSLTLPQGSFDGATVDGVQTGSSTSLLPGWYDVTATDSKGVLASTSTSLSVEAANVTQLPAGSTTLSATGQSTVTTAVSTQLDQCASSTDAANFRCPFAVPSDHQGAANNVTYTASLTGSPTLTAFAPSTMVASVSGTVTATASWDEDQYSGDGTTHNGDVSGSFTATVDLSASPPSVTFGG